MKLRIRNEKDEEKTLDLWLVKDKSGEVSLMSEKNGSSRYEFSISKDGTWTKNMSGYLKDTENRK